MKKFKTLTIRAPHRELVALLDTLKKQDKSIFTYKRTKSNEYARNIFHEENTVGCFSTNRKTLSKASVWVVITNEELTITNITPNEIGSLGVVMYNTILQTFYEDFLAKFLDEDMRNKVFITGEESSLSDVLSEETFKALQKWERCCDHTSPITYNLDRLMWFEFIILLHKDDTKLDMDDFEQWLQEDCKWSSVLNDIITDLRNNLEYSLDLLTHYDGRKY
jgi:hypothetical protein